MQPKIHYHTDCPFFGGCEKMLVNLWTFPELRKNYELSFSYRDTQRYTDGLSERVKTEFPVFPLRFPESSDLFPAPEKWFRTLRRGIRFASRFIYTLPLLVYEVLMLRKLFSSISPDILHINNGGYPAALSARAAAIAARLAGVPHVIMVVNNLAVGYRRPSRWLNYPVDRVVANSVSKFVTGSCAAARKLRKVLRLNGATCLAIHNGIALLQTTETPEETRKRLGLEKFNGVIFGVVALMETRKGHQVLLEALNELLGRADKDIPNIKILLEGDGPLHTDLQEYVKDKQLSEHCVFVGNEKNVMNFMAVLDVLILPSIDYEDFPNVVLEAMGLGKPVISSRLAGTPEQVVDGETGLLVEPRDANQLAVAITKLYLDEQMRLKMGQAGLRRFQKCFTADVAVKKYISLYQSLTGNETI